MYSKTLFFLTLFFLVTSMGLGTNVLGGEAREPAMATQELIQGIVSRSEAVFSCKMDYRQKSGFANNAKEVDDGAYHVVASGSSWRLYTKRLASEIPISRPKGGNSDANERKRDGFFESTQLTHRGKFVKYNVTPQYDGSLHNVADITKEKRIDFLYATYNGPPLFAGSFWFNCTKEFVLNHKDKAVRRAGAEINGMSTEVVEWEVSDTEKFKAFHAIPPTFQGGFLRLYISPQLGYALPRIEHLTADRMVFESFDSSEFKELTPGIFMPRNCRMQSYYTKGVPGFYVEYEITHVTQINEQIPDSEFIVQLPPGTIVGDARSGKSSTIFEIQQGGPIPEGLEDIIAVQPPPFWGRNWHSALVVGIGSGILLLALLVLWRRGYLRRRHQ